MSINREKQKILDAKGNILVTANPGTGKTLLLAHKYLSLIREGTKPEKILCLTFTEKAKKEMKKRILKLKDESEIDLNPSKLNVYTFHSYALNSLDNQEIISPNLLRFSIYMYIKENNILNYSDGYILDTLVPKIENLIRYLKSFAILPENINFDESKKFLPENHKLSRKELEKFLKEFIKIYKHYETVKKPKGFDYADLLIKFLSLSKKPSFDYVLVDELQDVNKMEAQIALKSADRFIAVGDKKQAIFGFQGGAITNFALFRDSSHFVLSENFRSTNQILNFSKEYFISKTKESSHKDELKNLTNAMGTDGSSPVIIKVEKNKRIAAAVDLLGRISDNKKTTAVILRTNNQITELAKELDKLGIEFATTFFSGSEDAKNDIITFLRGVLSNKVQEVKNSMFTPYSPVSIQDAFELADKKYDNVDDLLSGLKEFKKLRSKVKTKYDLTGLFKELITPIAISYGRQYYCAAEEINRAFFESLDLLENKKLDYIFDYIKSFDNTTEDIEKEKQIVLTTIHKAKGKEFDNLIYVPSVTREQTNFVDDVVESILTANGIDTEEELKEELLRINFVAFTRAKEKLFIITDKSSEYLSDYTKLTSLNEIAESKVSDCTSHKKDAYRLFVNRQYEKARALLENNNIWLIDFIHNYFNNLNSISFSSTNPNPFEYLIDNILNIKVYSPALKLGSEVHHVGEKFLKGEDYDIDEEHLPFKENIQKLTLEIKSAYPDLFQIEKSFEVPSSDISDIGEDLKLRGKIDAVFKNGNNYLILDWKTDIKADRSSKHRQQLEFYKRAFCQINNINNDNVEVAIAYIGLRSTLNTGEVHAELDLKQPSKSAFNTFISKVKKIVEWKNDPDLFLKELSEQKIKKNEILWRNVVEQYLFEDKNRT